MTKKTILPSNRTPVETAYDLAAAAAIDAIPIANIWHEWDPATCPEHLLPWLAWAMSVDDWGSNWSTEVKRQVIADSVAVHKLRGTPASIANDLASMLFACDYEEWRSYDGVPHTLRLGVSADSGAPITRQELTLLKQRLYRDKAARDHYEIELVSNLAVGCGAIAMTLEPGMVIGDLDASFIDTMALTMAPICVLSGQAQQNLQVSWQ